MLYPAEEYVDQTILHLLGLLLLAVSYALGGVDVGCDAIVVYFALLMFFNPMPDKIEYIVALVFAAVLFFTGGPVWVFGYSVGWLLTSTIRSIVNGIRAVE